MLCTSLNGFDPITGKKINSFPCGKCIACNINKRRKWTARMLLETLASESAAFVTLTYDDKHLPKDGELVPDHLTQFMRKLRDKLKDQEKVIRYFGCGEYGDKFGRAHYHAIIWNYQPVLQVDPKDPRRWYDHTIESAWTKGGTLTEDLMKSGKLNMKLAYVAGYVLKKLRNPDDKTEYNQPEFARMSRMPAIGTPAVGKMVDALTTRSGCEIIAALGTVPTSFRYENKNWPIPRVLREKIAYQLDVPLFYPARNIMVQSLWLDKLGVIGYGPQAEPPEETAAEAYRRYEAMERRLRKESISRMGKASRKPSKD